MERRIEQVAVPGRARNSRNSGPFDTGLCLPSQSISLTMEILFSLKFTESPRRDIHFGAKKVFL